MDKYTKEENKEFYDLIMNHFKKTIEIEEKYEQKFKEIWSTCLTQDDRNEVIEEYKWVISK